MASWGNGRKGKGAKKSGERNGERKVRTNRLKEAQHYE